MRMWGLVIKILASLILFEGWGFGSTFDRRRYRRTDVSYGSPAYKFCECGRKNVETVGDIRIVGGKQTTNNEYPWMALITVNESVPICGGSLINDRYVVSAAHCFTTKRYDNEEIKIIVGEYDICRADTTTVRFSIEKLIIHPNYDKPRHYADIVLVRLNMRVTFNKFVRPICLPKIESTMSTSQKFGGTLAIALGWGDADAQPPKKVCILRGVKLEIYRPEDCPNSMNTVVCAGINDGGHDSCGGDSGGPLQVVNSRDRYELIGVTSTGIGCGNNYPSFYTDVVAMMPWIMRITNRDSMYCWR